MQLWQPKINCKHIESVENIRESKQPTERSEREKPKESKNEKCVRLNILSNYGNRHEETARGWFCSCITSLKISDASDAARTHQQFKQFFFTCYNSFGIASMLLTHFSSFVFFLILFVCILFLVHSLVCAACGQKRIVFDLLRAHKINLR